MIYWYLFTILLLLGIGEVVCYRNSIVVRPKILIIVFVLVLLVIFAGGRLNTGLDYGGYLRYFYESNHGNLAVLNRIVEPGYVLLNKLMPSYRVLLFFMAIISIGIKVRAFTALKVKFPIFLLFIYFSTYFLFFDMGVMRQGLAIGICLYSIRYIKESRRTSFFICILLASSFHVSSVIFLIMYPLRNIRLKKTQYFIVILACTFVIIAEFNLINILGTISDLFQSEFVLNRFQFYLNPDMETGMKGTIIKRGLLGWIFVLMVYKSKSYQSIEEGKYCEDRWIYLNGYTASLVAITGLYVIGLHNIAGRFSAALYATSWFLYDYILYLNRKKIMYYIYFLIFTVLSVYSFYETLYFSSDNSYIKYLFFIE